MNRKEQSSRTVAFSGSKRKKILKHPLVDFLSIGYGKQKKAVKLP
ncbi:hypothetical protein [Sediminibacillus halophilus]|uniref:Uncharacterized protein n=1 Tax=Sediminibacillus halophilus TaxID=482461 RepID=A0A1G9U442_9BACI|nr:hypothetical protein [Sediminibacillus halophilus]SDM54434.1 hypothetical protein SAMN05216244_2844 [Sediminibacillus halophilus]